MFTGDEALRMMARATEHKVERLEVGNDPWWGPAYEYAYTYKVDGKWYKATYDRDGWPKLVEA